MSGGLVLQNAAVAMIVLAAMAWLSRRWWRRRKRGACACEGCPAAERAAREAAEAPRHAAGGLVSIEAPVGGPRGIVTIDPR